MLETMLDEQRRISRAGGGEPMPINARDAGDAIVIEASLPGVQAENVQLECSDNLLTIRAQSRVEDHDYLHQEIHSVSYLRQVSLPGEVQCQAAKAECRDGVLTVTVPKVKPKVPAKIRIEVTSQAGSGAANVNAGKVSSSTTVDAAPGTGYTDVSPRTRRKRT
jgi:HSP20 family molecular chaperone IbpA